MRESDSRLLAFPGAAELRAASKVKPPLFSDPRSLAVLALLDRVAPTDVTVLLSGETGTGKELAARYIHERSRPHGPFVAVNCGAFSESLAEAELFGHEAAAFTGAQHARPGWFEAADGGTLFLDEIGDMPLYLQVKLLRVLQEKQVVRIGARRPIRVDVRIVAATNVDLEAAVRARQFRRDLYYRLNVATVQLPALRERPGDIVPLARHFIEMQARRLGIEGAGLSPAAAQTLTRYSWPGNVRELENVVSVALIMSRGGLLEAGDLRLGAFADASPQSAQADCPPADCVADNAITTIEQGLRDLLDVGEQAIYERVERLLLSTAFGHCGGNQVHTARRLGISRNVVRAQLKRFGLLGREAAAAALGDVGTA